MPLRLRSILISRPIAHQIALALGATVVLICSATLLYLVMHASVDKRHGLVTQLVIFLSGLTIGIGAIIASGEAPNSIQGFRAWIAPKPLAIILVGLYTAFGTMATLLPLIAPPPAVESAPGVIEASVKALQNENVRKDVPVLDLNISPDSDINSNANDHTFYKYSGDYLKLPPTENSKSVEYFLKNPDKLVYIRIVIIANGIIEDIQNKLMANGKYKIGDGCNKPAKTRDIFSNGKLDGLSIPIPIGTPNLDGGASEIITYPCPFFLKFFLKNSAGADRYHSIGNSLAAIDGFFKIKLEASRLDRPYGKVIWIIKLIEYDEPSDLSNNTKNGIMNLKKLHNGDIDFFS